MYLRILCKIHAAGSIAQHPYVSQDSLQDPCLQIRIYASIWISGSFARSISPIHVSASLYLRILCKIHDSGSIHQHPYISQDPLQDPCLQAHISASLHLRILDKIHVFGFMFPHLRISGSSARSISPIHVLAFKSQHPWENQDPLQDPCCRIHSSAAICISGSFTRSTSSHSCLSIFVSHVFSARSTSPDTCLSIHLYLRILCKIHVSGSMCPIHDLASTNMDPLQDPCLWIHVSTSICISGTSARSMSPIHVSASLNLRILCKIHVSGSINQYPQKCQDPLPDPYFHAHVSASLHLRILRILCKTHVTDSCLSIQVSASMCISGSSARSMLPDP